MSLYLLATPSLSPLFRPAKAPLGGPRMAAHVWRMGINAFDNLLLASTSAIVERNTVGDDRILTIPNALSFVRLLLVPLFVWLVLGPEEDEWALVVLMFSGVTDYLDGKLARQLNQTSKIGAILDPVADRLFILAVVIVLGMRDIIPWWLAVLLPLRDVFLFGLVPFLRTRGYSSLPVHFLGKAATASLLYAFPLLLLGDAKGTVADLANVFGWAFTVWGVSLYWWAGLLYAFQVKKLMSTTDPVPR